MILNNFLCSLLITWIFSENAMNTFQNGSHLTKSKTTELKSNNDKSNQARKNVIKTLALVAFCYILCWTWNQIYYFMFNLGYPVDFSSNFFHFTIVMMLSNSVVNPFIYTFQYASFKQAAKQLFCKCLVKDVESNSHSLVSSVTSVSMN